MWKSVSKLFHKNIMIKLYWNFFEIVFFESIVLKSLVYIAEMEILFSLNNIHNNNNKKKSFLTWYYWSIDQRCMLVTSVVLC